MSIAERTPVDEVSDRIEPVFRADASKDRLSTGQRWAMAGAGVLGVTALTLTGIFVVEPTYRTADKFVGVWFEPAFRPDAADRVATYSDKPTGVRYLPPGEQQPVPTLVFPSLSPHELKAALHKNQQKFQKLVKCAHHNGPCPPPSTYSHEHYRQHAKIQTLGHRKPSGTHRHGQGHHKHEDDGGVVYFN